MANGIAGQLTSTVLQQPVAPAGKEVSQGIQDASRLIEIGQKAEATKLARQQLEAQKAKLMEQKVGRLLDGIKAGNQIKSDTARKAYESKFIPKLRDSLGLQDLFADDNLQFLVGNEENKFKMLILQGRVADEELSFKDALGIATDPQQMAEMDVTADELSRAGATPEQIQDLIGTREKALAREFKREVEDRKTQRREKERFTDFSKTIAKDVRSGFAKIEDAKQGIRTATSALTTLQRRLANGQEVDSITFNTAARALAKAFNSGAMTDRDVGDFRELTGIVNITKDAINKWITGNVNPAAVTSLMQIAQRSASALDQKANTLGGSFKKQFQQPEFAGREAELEQLSGLGNFLVPTLSNRRKVDSPTNAEAGGITSFTIKIGNQSFKVDKNTFKRMKNKDLILKKAVEASGLTEKKVKEILGAE